MGVFDLFKPKKPLSEADQKWNMMWDMWAKGEAASPYAELMNYDSEVNNGGHFQYFDNTDNCGDLKAEVEALRSVLPESLCENLNRAYAAFAAWEDTGDISEDELDKRGRLTRECDEIFSQNEELIYDILRAYADGLRL